MNEDKAYNLDTAYNEKFFRRRKSLAWRGAIMCDVIMRVFSPASVVDVGCGNGDLIGRLDELPEVTLACAIEGTENSRASIRENYFGPLCIQDVRCPLQLTEFRYELCLCLEVAEHIEGRYAHILTENLCKLSNTILFSAAGLGQGGLHHVNCRPFEYWFYKFATFDYARDLDLTEKFKEALAPWAHRKGIKAYAQNAVVFRHMLNNKEEV
jgi:hypothetical protein